MADRQEYQAAYRPKYKDQAKRVNLTFSLPEHRSFSRAAKSSGKALAAYVKRCALEAHDANAANSVPEELLENLADLDRVVRTIANNVNQMARHSNRIRQVLDEQEVFLHIHRLETELREAVARANRTAPKSEDGAAP